MSRRYSPMTIFPLFVLIVVLSGIFYTIHVTSIFRDKPLAQTHIVEPSPNTQDPIPSVPESTVTLIPPLSELIYPETKSISESSTSIRLESEADTETLTNWYKEKIRSLGYDSKSFVSANKNGNIENRLIGSKENEELYIEIKKPNGFIKTAINIEIANP